MISNKTNRHRIEEVLEQFANQGISRLKESLEQLFNQLMLAERENFVGAGPHERSDDRRGYCNGFKDKKLLTRSGELELKIPQVREGGFYPSCLAKGEKVEQALKLAFFLPSTSMRLVILLAGMAVIANLLIETPSPLYNLFIFGRDWTTVELSPIPSTERFP